MKARTVTSKYFFARKVNKTLFLFSLLASLIQASVSLGIVYVDKNATGANNGDSWADAYTTIQSGIDDAATSGGDEVWVATGTYYEAIVMKSGVALYGGFAGAETSRDERNWTTNVTTIDASTARYGSPAYHVVIMDNITTATIDGFTIAGGNANGGETNDDGGGIFCYNMNDTNLIKNNIISGNSAVSHGGGIYCYSSSPVITNNTIAGNLAYYGGGIDCYYYSLPAITNNTISGNSADSYGGGIFCSWSSPEITSNIISGNSASYYGGGIFCYYCSPQITNNTIEGNPASGFYGEGGGIYCYSSSPAITNNTIAGNSAAWAGGGIRCGYSSSPAITNNTIAGNSVDDDGGGIFCSDSSPEITDNTISGNSASYGGGIYCAYSSPQISNNIISGNSAVFHGGGIYCYSSSPVITNNTIAGNLAYYGGGIDCYYYSLPAITNNTISGNSATSYGGGIFCSYSSPAITNNTIAGNLASYYGGGIFCYYSSPNIKNTIFSNNNNYDIYEGDINSDPMVSYNDFYGNPDGIYYDEGTTPYTSVSAMDSAIAECSNNIGLNPLFVGDTLSGGTWTAAPVYNSATFQTTLTNSSASWTVNEHAGRLLNPDTSQNKQFVIVSNTATTINVWGNVTPIADKGDTYQVLDYHLQVTSPCIDSGCLITGLTEDFEGDPRPFDGTSEPRGDGSDYDIGADEFVRALVHWHGWVFY
jgi:parallel beta-helix repeat protein